MQITFDCPTCRERSENLRKYQPSWAQIAGYCCVEWSDRDASHHRVPWPRLDTPPRVDMAYFLQVRHPFQAASPEPFWALFRPANATMNGWDAHPEELPASGIAQCTLQAILSQDKDSAWIVVEVRQVIPIAEIGAHFAEDRSAWSCDALERGKTTARQDDLSLIESQLESDVGEWVVTQSTETGPAALLYGTWGWHEDFFYAGHHRLSTAISQSSRQAIP